MRNFVTDRTQAHIDRCKALSKIGWDNMTAAERAEWSGVASKGAYNYTDLNRVEAAVSELASLFGLTLTVKTDWGLWDNPTQSQMERYLGNVVAIRNACPGSVDFPTLPDRMNGLTYEMANNIEKTLSLAYRCVDAIPRAGELFVGEVC